MGKYSEPTHRLARVIINVFIYWHLFIEGFTFC